MAMAMLQNLAWKPSSDYYCLLKTQVHQSLQNKGKKAKTTPTIYNTTTSRRDKITRRRTTWRLSIVIP
jgi:hypothetical protein